MCGWLLRLCARPSPACRGRSAFAGRIVHPQFWPRRPRRRGQAVAVIGSGATAITLVPELAATAAQVTMVQRSAELHRLAAASIGSHRGVAQAHGCRRRAAYRHDALEERAADSLLYRLARRRPDRVAAKLIALGPGRHRRPDSRLRTSRRPTSPGTSDCAWCRTATCSRRSAGGVSVATGAIERFTERGIRLETGQRSRCRTSSSPPPASRSSRSARRNCAVDGEPADVADSPWSTRA